MAYAESEKGTAWTMCWLLRFIILWQIFKKLQQILANFGTKKKEEKREKLRP